jgi:hypothetical protein
VVVVKNKEMKKKMYKAGLQEKIKEVERGKSGFI